jgi:flagellar hook-basal body complex protein FliE
MVRLLAEMSALRTQAQGGIPVAAPGAQDFGSLLRGALDGVNRAQNEAESLAQAFETGAANVDLAQVMVSMQKANIAFQTMTQVRNKLVNAYQEIMNMPI